MDSTEKDIDQLATILRYCDRLDNAINHFGKSYKTFCANEPYQDSCSLCLIQIGEAVNRLSDTFKMHNPQIQWSKIYLMRCHLVHGYAMFDSEIAWDAIENYIPSLRLFCEKKLYEL